MADYLPFDPRPRVPARLPPAGSCDSQFHVFGPRDVYPVRAGAVYEMPTATHAAALRMHRALGIERGIVVQATTYGADHQVVLDALAALGPNYKGCANAAVLTDRDDAYLARLHDAGVRGVRFSRQGLGITFSAAEFERAIARTRELGWYVKVQPDAKGIVDQIAPFEHLDMPVVVDHMARPDVSAGRGDPSLARLLSLLDRGNFWVMLSLAEKISKTGYPWDDVLPIAAALLERAPGRCIWGSDWPHPISVKQPPNEADLLELVYRFAPDEALLRRILVDNPATLFGYPQ
jgi:2-pyrone-4,6-dicarboxylate lactonase